MNIVILQNTTPVEGNWYDTFLNFIHKIPFTELLVGVVVPIVAAWISYALAERATRRKEYNRLFIQIELVKRELLRNNDSLMNFTSKYEEKIKLQKGLGFPLAFCKGLLIDVLNKLGKIKTEYFYFDKEMLYEKVKKLENNFEEEKHNDIQNFYNYNQIITQDILEVITRLEKHQSKIKKWCK
ncbi:hypothetical protein NSA47_14855 [Irregularibacter muris]|uniref:Uncharacterized protein n=1 Tax=Irregularibacter muris TaxID=1796619 RepID=A0AAE3HK45_9FIRM|nr:hypothetical protein [Irregularibacter muris]MCR1900244.1 hypothetical protein [Irregularibacter muris]